MSGRTRIGTVQVLVPRIYNTEKGEYAVSPGTYPVFRDNDTGQHVVMFEGRRNHLTRPDVEPMGDGMFVVRPGGDRPSGAVAPFPYGWGNDDQFADLLTDPVFTEGDPAQRLRFRANCEVSS